MERNWKQALVIKAGNKKVDLSELAGKLKEIEINTMMVEGGATLNWGMLSAGLVDEIYTFVGNLIIGGATAPTFTDGEGFSEAELLGLELISAEKIEEGVLLKWKVKGKRNKGLVDSDLSFCIFQTCLAVYKNFEFAFTFEKFPHSAVIYPLDVFQAVLFEVNPHSFEKINHLFQVSLFIRSGFLCNCFTCRVVEF